jgi:hypothetical protein
VREQGLMEQWQQIKIKTVGQFIKYCPFESHVIENNLNFNPRTQGPKVNDFES